MAEVFHYTSCGLQNVWLRNGFNIKETQHGRAVAIHDVEGLHRAIGLYIIQNKPKLSGAEIRFLRKELDLPQASLAALLGVGETTVRGWERHRTKITKPAERLLRALYREYVCEESTIRELIERISQLNRDAYKSNRIEFEETQAGWSSAA